MRNRRYCLEKIYFVRLCANLLLIGFSGLGLAFMPQVSAFAFEKKEAEIFRKNLIQRWVFRSQKSLSAADLTRTKQNLQQRLQWLTGKPWPLTVTSTRNGGFLFSITGEPHGLSALQLQRLLRPVSLQWKLKTATGLWRECELESQYLETVGAQYDQGQWQVRFKYQGQGVEQLAQLTREQVQQTLGIFIENRLISSPLIQEPILGGEAVITGLFTAAEATQIVEDIRWAMAPVVLDFVGVAAVSR